MLALLPPLEISPGGDGISETTESTVAPTETPEATVTPTETPGATAAPTDEEPTDETTRPPMPGFMCEGEMGVAREDICCAVSSCLVIASGHPLVFASALKTNQAAAACRLESSEVWVRTYPTCLSSDVVFIPQDAAVCMCPSVPCARSGSCSQLVRAHQLFPAVYVCKSSCGICGGTGCDNRDGGDENCCMGDIRTAGELCSDKGAAPCIMSGEP